MKNPKWNFSIKDIIYLIVIGIIGFALAKNYITMSSISNRLMEHDISFKKITDSIARAETKIVGKEELENFLKGTELSVNKIKKDLQKMEADLSAVGKTVASIEGKIESDQSSDNSVSHTPPDQPSECKFCDIYEYTTQLQKKDIKIGEMPYGTITFDASKAKPWSLKYDDIDIIVNTALGLTKEKRRIFYHAIYLKNKSRPELKDKQYTLKLTSSEFVESIPFPTKWHWWAPSIDISIDNMLTSENMGRYDLGASIGFTFLALGGTPEYSNWRFARLGLGFNTNGKIFGSFEPARYNLGDKLPLINDLWLGLNLIYTGKWGAGISVGTRL